MNRLEGDKFGSIEVIKDSGYRDAGGRILWKCKCDCGNIYYIIADNLRKGYKKSCRCELDQIKE